MCCTCFCISNGIHGIVEFGENSTAIINCSSLVFLYIYTVAVVFIHCGENIPSWTSCIGQPMEIHDGIFPPQWINTTAIVYIYIKQGNNNWLLQLNFHQTSQCHVWHLDMQKYVQHIMYHNYHYPNPSIPIQCIGFITKVINPIDIVNIPPYHLPEIITKVSTTERNIIHNMTKQINNIIMGINSTCSNT